MISNSTDTRLPENQCMHNGSSAIGWFGVLGSEIMTMKSKSLSFLTILAMVGWVIPGQAQTSPAPASSPSAQVCTDCQPNPAVAKKSTEINATPSRQTAKELVGTTFQQAEPSSFSAIDDVNATASIASTTSIDSSLFNNPQLLTSNLARMTLADRSISSSFTESNPALSGVYAQGLTTQDTPPTVQPADTGTTPSLDSAPAAADSPPSTDAPQPAVDSSNPQTNPNPSNSPDSAQPAEPTTSADAKPKIGILSETKFSPTESPLARYQLQLPTSEHLRAGEVVIDYRQRFFFTNSIANTAREGTPFWYGAGVRWGITNSTELAVAYQDTDPVSIQNQGPFNIFVNDSTPTWDFALELKQRIWQNKAKTQSLSGVVSVGGFTEPEFIFTDPAGGRTVSKGNGFVPAVSLPYTARIGDRLSLSIGPTVAFFPEDTALFLSRPPVANPGSFGTTFGLTGAISYQLHPKLLLWGNAFVPLTGNNSINQTSGLPAKTIAFNAGLRFLVNPRVGLDIFATNTFGTLGPLALTADHNDIGVGAGLVFMPGFIPANRKNNPNTIAGNYNEVDSPLTTDGLGFLDGGTVPEGRFLLQAQGGSNGIMGALRYGAVKDFEIGAYFGYVFGTVDESEQGISGKIRLLNQAEGAPFTASLAISLAQANGPIFNFKNNNADFFDNSGNNKNFPFLFSGQLSSQNALYLATASVPLQYQFSRDTAVWVTPTLGFLQRSGLDLAGVNVGGSVRIFGDVSVLGEVGYNFAGEGNAFINGRLANRVPWNFAIRWQPGKFLGFDYKKSLIRPSFELFVSNRIGASAWQQFRVLEGNSIAVGAGVSIPF